jgi:DNA repair ATPase RecN
MGDVASIDRRKKTIRNLVSEAVLTEVAGEIKPELETLREKRDELKLLRRELTKSAEELREQATDLQEARRDAERINQSRNTDDS